MNLAQLPTINDVTKAGDVIQAWPFWLIMLFILVAVLVIGFFIWKGTSKNLTESSVNQKAIIDSQVSMQQSYTDLFKTMTSMMGDMQAGAKVRDQQIDLTLKQMDLVLKAMDRNAQASESNTGLLTGIRNETTLSGNRTQALHDALVTSANDTGTAIGTMTAHIVGQVDKSHQNMTAHIDQIPQKVLEIFEPARSELVVKLDNLGPDVAKAIVPDIEHMFKDCLELAKENDALTKEAQEQRARADTAERQLALLVQPDPPTPGNISPLPVAKTVDDLSEAA